MVSVPEFASFYLVRIGIQRPSRTAARAWAWERIFTILVFVFRLLLRLLTWREATEPVLYGKYNTDTYTLPGDNNNREKQGTNGTTSGEPKPVIVIAHAAPGNESHVERGVKHGTPGRPFVKSCKRGRCLNRAR